MQQIKPKNKAKLVRFQKKGNDVRIVLTEQLKQPFSHGDTVDVFLSGDSLVIQKGTDYKVLKAQYKGTNHLCITVPLPEKPENTDSVTVAKNAITIKL